MPVVQEGSQGPLKSSRRTGQGTVIHGPLFALARVTGDPFFVQTPVWSPFRPLNQQTSRRKILGSTKIVEELWGNTTTGSSYCSLLCFSLYCERLELMYFFGERRMSIP